MARFYIGTAGWSYRDWEGTVYPLRRPAGFHALVFLAHLVNLVEINSTFYRPPVSHIAQSWIRRVADHPDFQFAVKLHRKFTHQREEATQQDVDLFKRGIDPLQAGGRLAAVLMQFPWSFSRSPSHLEYLTWLFRIFAEYPLTLELRHESWMRPDFLALLTEQNVTFCNIDQPVIGKSIPPTAHSTNPDTAYVRLHGRNYGDWFKEGAGRDARYNYLYSDAELDEWVERIRDLGGESKKVLTVTNNHYRGQALANALQLRNKLTGEQLDIPRELLNTFPVLKKIIRRIEKGQLNLFEED